MNVVNGLLPDNNDGAFIGAAGQAFSDLFLAEGGVINFDSSDVTITQGGNNLTIAGTSQTHFNGIISASRILTTGNSTLGDSSTDQHTINGIIKGFEKVSGSISSTGSFGIVEATNVQATTIGGTLGTAAQPNVTTVGTIGTGVWQGTAIASAYLDADTAHLTTDQTFTGNKTFSQQILANAGISGSLSTTASFGHIIYDSGTIDGGSF